MYVCLLQRSLCTRAQIDFLGESTEGNLHLANVVKGRVGLINVFGMEQLDDIYTLPLAKLRAATQVCYQVVVVVVAAGGGGEGETARTPALKWEWRGGSLK